MQNSKYRLIAVVFLLLGWIGVSRCLAQELDATWVNSHYDKREIFVPMRDGVNLYTAIYVPKETNRRHPILMMRTPYGIAYGSQIDSRLWGALSAYVKDDYILVMQDVRGKGRSEGTFEDIRPLYSMMKGHLKGATDEATDTYDTIDWLLHHLKSNNGCVGLWGSSYCGFYAMQGALCGHPALKCAVPQAPVVSWFLGDDFHHGGALMLRDAYSFTNRHCRPRIQGSMQDSPGKDLGIADEYQYYLRQQTLSQLTEQFGGEVPMWDSLMAHPTHDAWWKARDYRQYCHKVKPAILVVGGLWDAEDYYGTCQLYRALRTQSPQTDVRLAIGPWRHGGWQGQSNSLGMYNFGEQNQAAYYRKQIEYPFVRQYLQPELKLRDSMTRVQQFVTGINRWMQLKESPILYGENGAPSMSVITYYLQDKGQMSTHNPDELSSSSSYISDPSHPVPYTAMPAAHRSAAMMTEDQRPFATRPDVLSFATSPLGKDLVFMGPVQVKINAAISTTDADFVVKILDIYPDSAGQMAAYQLPVRMDVLRGRFRNGFDHESSFVPGKISEVNITLQNIAHAFRQGHRIGIQIQSSWFPLIDINPQQCINIATAKLTDFMPAHVTIYHQRDAASTISFGVLK
ncbi:MAG: CocE/NonD family hydrolase [Prevotellaceae bacterium]|nr:CocE/NonD family hydrolase [Prevotellaceae bacterium]MDY3856307.1 CocE/NonD family hydrolase [Bacteroidaceae bacterium]